MGGGSAASLKKALCVSKEGRLGCSDGTGVRPLLRRTRKVRRMLAIKHKRGLTKSDQMINIQLGQTLHLLKVSVASNDLVGNNSVCFGWELQNQISQAASKHEGDLIRASSSLHHQTLFISIVERRLGGEVVRIGWKWLILREHGCHGTVQEVGVRLGGESSEAKKCRNVEANCVIAVDIERTVAERECSRFVVCGY